MWFLTSSVPHLPHKRSYRLIRIVSSILFNTFIVMQCPIGSIIKAEMERQGRTPTWLARKIYCDRTNIHKIYKKDSIDTKLLFNISKALRHNFFCELAEFYQTQAENNFIDVAVENSLADPMTKCMQ